MVKDRWYTENDPAMSWARALELAEGHVATAKKEGREYHRYQIYVKALGVKPTRPQ